MAVDRRWPTVVALVLVTSACGSTVVRRGNEPTAGPIETSAVGSAVGVPGDEVAPPDAGEATEGPARPPSRFILTLVDQNGGHPPAGIPVTVDGGESATYITDDDGTVTIDDEPGFYTFKVPVRCYDSLQVQAGGSGRFGIADGQTAEAEVEVVWRRRFAPSGPVFASVGPFWPIGRDVRLRYDVIDHCRDGARATKASVVRYRFTPAKNLTVIGTPKMTSDGDGYAFVVVRCSSTGPTKLTITDRDNAEDTLDLVGAESSYGQRPSCGDA